MVWGLNFGFKEIERQSRAVFQSPLGKAQPAPQASGGSIFAFMKSQAARFWVSPRFWVWRRRFGRVLPPAEMGAGGAVFVAVSTDNGT